MYCFYHKNQWRIQNFRDTGLQLQPIILTIFSPKLHENEKGWTGTQPTWIRQWFKCIVFGCPVQIAITIFGYSVISEIFKMVFKSGFTGTWSIVASLLDSLSQTWGSTAEHSDRAYLKVRFSVNFQLMFSTRVPAEIYICSILKRFDV